VDQHRKQVKLHLLKTSGDFNFKIIQHMDIYIGNIVCRIRRESSKITRHRSLVGGDVFLYPAHIVLKIRKVSLGITYPWYFIQYTYIYLIHNLTQHSYPSLRLPAATYWPGHHQTYIISTALFSWGWWHCKV